MARQADTLKLVNHAQPIINEAAASAYRFTFGKYQGKSFSEIDACELTSYIAEVWMFIQKNEKASTPAVKEMLARYDEFEKMKI